MINYPNRIPWVHSIVINSFLGRNFTQLTPNHSQWCNSEGAKWANVLFSVIYKFLSLILLVLLIFDLNYTWIPGSSSIKHFLLQQRTSTCFASSAPPSPSLAISVAINWHEGTAPENIRQVWLCSPACNTDLKCLSFMPHRHLTIQNEENDNGGKQMRQSAHKKLLFSSQ